MKDTACSQCDDMFAFITRLNSHFKSEHQGKNFTCNECNKNFRKTRLLSSHRRSVNKKLTARTCNECGKSIRLEQSFTKTY